MDKPRAGAIAGERMGAMVVVGVAGGVVEFWFSGLRGCGGVERH